MDNKACKIHMTAAAVLCIAAAVLAIFISADIANTDSLHEFGSISEISDNMSYVSYFSAAESEPLPYTDNSSAAASDSSSVVSSVSESQTASEPEHASESSDPQPPETSGSKVEQLLSRMTLEQKVYQMMIVTPEALTGSSNVTVADESMKKALGLHPVGGLIYFANNIVSPDQVKTMLANTQKYAIEVQGLPLLTCIDEEGGRVARIANNPSFGVQTFPNMADITTGDEAYFVGSTIGGYLSELGFNVDFAPVADVLTNSDNTVIGNRSFGSDPHAVSSLALQVAQGLKSNGVMPVYKHFPGHGATAGDTHNGFAYTDKTLDELMQSELIPFISAAENNIDFVMTAHISVPNITGNNTPSSLSKSVVTDILKERLGYKGLIVTDGLNMQAVTGSYSAGDAAVLAVKAGNDMLLLPNDMTSAVSAIVSCVESGDIPEARINESVTKILLAKLKLDT